MNLSCVAVAHADELLTVRAARSAALYFVYARSNMHKLHFPLTF